MPSKKGEKVEAGIWKKAGGKGYVAEVNLGDAITGERVRRRKSTGRLDLARKWRDTLSARLGSTVQFWNGGSASLGAYYETGAVPPNYEHIDFMSFDRFGVSIGFGAEIGMFHLQTAYMHVFQETRAVSESLGKVYQQRPLSPCPDDCVRDTEGISGVPVNAGIFESSYDIFSLSVEMNF